MPPIVAIPLATAWSTYGCQLMTAATAARERGSGSSLLLLGLRREGGGPGRNRLRAQEVDYIIGG
eukprot:598917-Prymnesium_polylepis.1